MEKDILLYHGSEKIIEQPKYGLGRKTNDFGQGFYCTENKELAKEWAVSSLRNGFANRYLLHTNFLRILYLNTPEYTILNWIALLVEHRLFAIRTPVARRAKQYLLEHFSINVNAYDLIIGYRADDSYYDYAEAFINNSITVEQLSAAMQLGRLGEQIVLKSEFAFSQLEYQGWTVADRNQYYAKKQARNEDAIHSYQAILEKETDGLFIQDIIRGGVTNEDKRIPRNASRLQTNAPGGSL